MNFSAMMSAFYSVLLNNENQCQRLGLYNVIIGNVIGYRGSVSMRLWCSTSYQLECTQQYNSRILAGKVSHKHQQQ